MASSTLTDLGSTRACCLNLASARGPHGPVTHGARIAMWVSAHSESINSEREGEGDFHMASGLFSTPTNLVLSKELLAWCPFGIHETLFVCLLC